MAIDDEHQLIVSSLHDVTGFTPLSGSAANKTRECMKKEDCCHCYSPYEEPYHGEIDGKVIKQIPNAIPHYAPVGRH